MTKKLRDPFKEKKERLSYAFFYCFIASFVLKAVIGLLSGSKFLLVSGLYAFFGVFLAVVSLMHIGAAYPARRMTLYFNRGKLEFIIIFGVSVIIALSTVFLLFSISHMLFFHTLYPIGFSAAWTGILVASLNYCLVVWVKGQLSGPRSSDEQRLLSMASYDFVLSVLASVSVVLSRIGWYAFDYGCAIILAVGIIAYSISFFFASIKGLMDASCDKKTVAFIEEAIRKAQDNVVLQKLRVNNTGEIFEIIAVFSVSAQMPVSEIETTFKNIKNSLQEKFTKPHETFLGIISASA